CPVIASQSFAVPSLEPVSTNLPSELKAAASTGPPCRKGGPMGCLVDASQTWALQSSLAVTKSLPLGLKAMRCTVSTCWESWPIGCPTAASQPHTFPSRVAVRIVLPSGLYAASTTWPQIGLGFRKTATGIPPATSHSLPSSKAPVRRVLPPGP